MSLTRDMMPAWELRKALDIAEAEVERLRAESERLTKGLDATASALTQTIIALRALNAELVAGLKTLAVAYVNLMEVGRDRIKALGGDCDPVDVMEAGDPSLREARALISKAEGR